MPIQQTPTGWADWARDLAGSTGVRCHVSPPASPYERGAALGEAERDAIHATVDFYRRLLGDDFGLGDDDLRAAGATLRGSLGAAPWRTLVEEVDGIATAAGIDPELLLAVNARTELLAGGRYASGAGGPDAYRGPRAARECSAVALADPAAPGCLVAQNWDFHPGLRPSRLLWLVLRADGSWSCTFTEAGIVGKIGLNSRGVALTVNLLNAQDDGGLAGVPTHFVARRLLDDAGGAGAALSLLSGATVSASMSYNVASCDAAGCTAFSAELTPSGMRLAWPEDGVLVHTNHFLEPDGLTDRRLGPQGGWDSVVRRQALVRRLAAADAPGMREVVAGLSDHHDAPGSVCVHQEGPDVAFYDQGVTLASIVMDPGARRMWLAGGQPCRTPFVEIPLPGATGDAP